MRLLRRYLQPKRSNEVQTVIVAGEHHAACRGKRFDLRTGAAEPSKAARYGRDGARVEWTREGQLVLESGDARTQLTGFEGLSTGVLLVGDEVVLLQADDRRPLLCIDRRTGKPLGRFEQMRGERFGPTRLYDAHVFDPRDGKTVWLVDGGRIVHYDLSTRRPLRTLSPAAGEKLLGLAVHPSGRVLTWARKLSAGFDAAHDELVVFSAEGREVKRRAQPGMSAAPLSNGFVVFDATGRRFVFVDLDGDETGTLAHDSDWALLVPLPSLREWITIGGHGEWDHHGEDELAPRGPAANSRATPKKPKKPKAASAGKAGRHRRKPGTRGD